MSDQPSELILVMLRRLDQKVDRLIDDALHGGRGVVGHWLAPGGLGRLEHAFLSSLPPAPRATRA